MICLIDITLYSFLWVNITSGIYILIYVLIDILITNNKNLTIKLPMWITVLFTAIISIRLFFPVELLKISQTFASYEILPPIDNVIHKRIMTMSNGFNISFSLVLSVIWCGVSIILLLIYFVNYYKLCKIIKYTPQLDNKCFEILGDLKRKNKFKFKTKLIQSSSVEFPAECGYFNQTIFINDYNYTEDELRYILLHELVHFEYGTNWLNLFINILNIVFWWNPIIYLYKKHINNIVEIYVDSKVTKEMNDSDKCNYIKCIFKVSEIITNNDTSNLKHITPLIKNDSDKLLLKRFNNIKYKNKINIPMCISIILLMFTYIFTSCKYVVQPGWEPPAEDLQNMEISEFTAENSYITIEDGQWVLYYNGELFLSGIDINNFKNVPIKK